MDNQTLQQQYDDLINQLGATDVKLVNPIRFALTPHSPIQWINILPVNYDIEQWGQAKHTVIQRLRWILVLTNQTQPNYDTK